jgi:hypothetical protein
MVSENESVSNEDPIIELVKQEYLPEILQISDELERGSSPTFNKTASRVYLRKGGVSYLVPKGLEWFAINYYNLRTQVRRIPLTLFLSYPREDLWLAYKIQKILSEIGVYVYVAELFPEPGMTLWEKIKTMIENSDLVIVLWTKNALSSAFVNQELGFAEARQKLIVPIVEKGAVTHGLLNGREHIAFERGRDTETYSTLCQSLYSFLSKKLEQQMASAFGLGLGILFLVALFAAFGSKK